MADGDVYEPTEHHLRRLREQGRGPHSGAVRGTAVLAAAGLAGWAAVGLAQRFLGQSLAEASINMPVPGTQLLSQLAHSWSLVAAIAAGLLLAMVLIAWIADAILAGIPRQRRTLISRAGFSPKAVWPWVIAVLCQIAALALGWVWLWRGIMVYQADPLLLTARFLGSAGMVIAIIALGIAVLDAAVSRAAFLSSARMTRQQFLEEQKETAPPRPVVLRRAARLQRRR